MIREQDENINLLVFFKPLKSFPSYFYWLLKGCQISYIVVPTLLLFSPKQAVVTVKAGVGTFLLFLVLFRDMQAYQQCRAKHAF